MRQSAVQTTRPILAVILALTILGSAGCGRKPVTPPQSSAVGPVAESNWRNRLSLPPERITRNWVLSDNTMLVELEHNSDGYGDTPQAYSYEVYDPKSDSSSPIVLRGLGMVRKVGDRSVEFVCNLGGVLYLGTYDIAARALTATYPVYGVSTPRQFGLTNVWAELLRVTAGEGGVELVLGNYPGEVPWMKVHADEQSRTLIVEMPGLAANEHVFEDVKPAKLPDLVDAVTVERLTDPVCPGVVIRIKSSAKDWPHLSYSIVPAFDSGFSRFTLRLAENAQPVDLAFAIEPPGGWADWRQNTATRRYGTTIAARLDDGTMILSGDYFFTVCDPATCLERVLVGDSSTPTLASVSDREVVFFCRGGGGGPCMSFPYFEVYDVATRSLTTREMDLAVTTPVEVGGSCFTYKTCRADAKGIAFSFKEGPVMAGGGGPPTAITWADDATCGFYVEFPGAITDGLQFGPLDLSAAPYVVSASLANGVRGKNGETAPGVTVCLTLDAVKWPLLTYHIDTLADPDAPRPEWGYTILVLSFSDQKPATDISGIPQR